MTIINADGITVPDSRKPRKARLIGHTDLFFNSRIGVAYPANHCNQRCWDFVSNQGDCAIADDHHLEWLED